MATQQTSRINEDNILQVALDSIIPNPLQPRRIFREDDPKLLELSASIKEHGLLQPIVVTRLEAHDSAGTAVPNTNANDPWFIGEAETGTTRSVAENAHVVQF